MNSSTRSVACSLRLAPWWAWISVASLLASGCNGCKAPGPRELVCKPIAYHEVLNPEQGAGKAPFSIERLGPEVKDMPRIPDMLVFTGENRVTIGWSLSDFSFDADAIYSPDEGLARDVDAPSLVYPMKRFFDGKAERARFGFRSTVCRKPVKWGEYWNCDLTENELFLVADMTCSWELIDPAEWE